MSNGLGGLVLVIIVLMLFLRPMLAFWVSVGIVVAYMGTLFLLLTWAGTEYDQPVRLFVDSRYCR